MKLEQAVAFVMDFQYGLPEKDKGKWDDVIMTLKIALMKLDFLEFSTRSQIRRIEKERKRNDIDIERADYESKQTGNMAEFLRLMCKDSELSGEQIAFENVHDFLTNNDITFGYEDTNIMNDNDEE